MKGRAVNTLRSVQVGSKLLTETIGLASTTSFSGFFKIGKNGVLSETTALHRGPNLIGERRKQIFFDFEWKRFPGSRQVKPDNFPVPCDNDRFFLFKQACRAISKLSDGLGLHVIAELGTVWYAARQLKLVREQPVLEIRYAKAKRPFGSGIGRPRSFAVSIHS